MGQANDEPGGEERDDGHGGLLPGGVGRKLALATVLLAAVVIVRRRRSREADREPVTGSP